MEIVQNGNLTVSDVADYIPFSTSVLLLGVILTIMILQVKNISKSVMSRKVKFLSQVNLILKEVNYYY